MNEMQEHARVKKGNLSHTAYDILVKRIITNVYPPGTMVNEIELVEDLQVSRTPIHHAIIRLQEEKLIHILPKKGFIVSDVTPDSIRDIFDLRELIETYALEQFGRLFKKEDILRFINIFKNKTYQTMDEFLAFLQSDGELHTHIVGLSGNHLMCAQYASLANHIYRLSYLGGYKDLRRIDESGREHYDILKALLEDDIKKASEALAFHLRYTRETAYEQIIISEADSITIPK